MSTDLQHPEHAESTQRELTRRPQQLRITFTYWRTCNIALIFWMLQFRFYLFPATQQHLIPKPVSPKWARIYNTQSTHRTLNEYSGAYTDENFVSLFLNFVSLFLNGMHATSQLRITETHLWTPQKSIGKSSRFRSSGSTFWFRSTRLRFGHFSTHCYLKKLFIFQ